MYTIGRKKEKKRKKKDFMILKYTQVSSLWLIEELHTFTKEVASTAVLVLLYSQEYRDDFFLKQVGSAILELLWPLVTGLFWAVETRCFVEDWL